MNTMSSIDPSIQPSGPSGPTTDLSTTGTGTQSTGSSAIIDTSTSLSGTTGTSAAAATTSASSPVLNLPKFDLNSWLKSILPYQDKLNEQQYEQQVQNILATKNMHLNAILTALGLTALYSEITRLGNQQTNSTNTLNNAISTLNKEINNINNQLANTQNPPGEDEAQIQAMNQAIEEYNAGTISTDDFNAAVATYESYIATRNPTLSSLIDQLNTDIATYNTAVQKYNDSLAGINALREGLGLDPLPVQPFMTNPLNLLPDQQGIPPLPPPDPTNPTLPLIPDEVPVDTVPKVPQPGSTTTLVNQIFTPLFNSQFNSSLSFTNFLQMLIRHRDFVNYYLRGTVLSLPDAYILPKPQVFLTPSQGAASTFSGVGLATLVTGLQSTALDRILSQGIFQKVISDQNSPVPSKLVNQLALYEIRLLTLLGLNTGIQMNGIIPFNNTESYPNNIALGLSFAGQINNLVAEGTTAEAVQQFLQNNFPNLTKAQLQELGLNLTAGLNLSLLQVATLVLAQTLGIPGLPTAVASNVTGLPSTNSILNLEGASEKEVLENPVSIANIKANLSDQLLALGAIQDEEQANTIANDAINNALNQQSVIDASTLQASLQQELINQGINAAAANQAADNTKGYVLAESTAQYLLDLTVNQNVLNASTLKAQIEAAGATISNDAITRILSVSAANQRELRDRIAQELITEGIKQQDAIAIATKAVVGQETVNLQAVSASDLANEIADKVIAQLTPVTGATEAQSIANQLVSTLIGSPTEQLADDIRNPNSILNQINGQVQHLQKLNNVQVNQAIKENFHTFMKPNIDLFAFNNKIIDPGYNLIYSMFTGLMYQHDMPKNFLRSVDFQI